MKAAVYPLALNKLLALWFQLVFSTAVPAAFSFFLKICLRPQWWAAVFFLQNKINKYIYKIYIYIRVYIYIYIRQSEVTLELPFFNSWTASKMISSLCLLT